ncbi:HK97 family phage prohead protease [Pseudolysinimonas kribbensis]|uniref:Prohead serine protease domain-containing protein n=1 Tax=Pseudolysinimonas kribbensis TaxID=433641 RepID=A0ABQ6K3E9_9MICO|nr:HK97 family phage prohead protease [Pseudolysinimonas kribbensis]GMA93829.1 hypothetical protein GCM10025881_06530 [Pseudolysinimonas kribbensis]
MTAPDLTKPQQRSFEARAALSDATDGERIVAGIAVPFGDPILVQSWGDAWREQFTKATVFDGAERALLAWRHGDVIGKLTTAESEDDGLRIEARISQTALGDEAYTLARDGVIDRFSIGFVPVEYSTEAQADGTDLVTYTRVQLLEVSLVPWPAYDAAEVSEVRSSNPTATPPLERSTPAVTDAIVTPADLAEVRTSIEDLTRSVATLSVRDREPAAPDTRSAGEVLRAIVSGDEATVRAYNALYERRDYAGGTTADAVVKPGWVGDLTRIFDASSGVLAASFSTGTLPATGNSIEFAELSTNTLSVAEQAAEGDDIAAGKVTIDTRTAPVKTYAGSTTLTRQEVERSTVGVLDTSLNGLAIAAGARRKAYLRAAFAALVTANAAIADNGGVVVLGATLAAATADNWESALIDAAIKFEALNLPVERMIVSGSVFKKLRGLTVAGERVFQTAKDNASGTLDLPGLSGDFAGLPVLLDSGQSGDSAVFTNSLAIRQYNSPLVSLSDEAISNLSKSFAVYAYGATAAEIPAAVVPVKLAAN